MKKLLVLGTILLTASAFASVEGDKIHFQKHSTWVSAVYSKSLCFDGENFKARLNKCLQWRNGGDDRRCVKYGKITAVQPQESTRSRCVRWTGRDQGNCAKWETVTYFQSEVRDVKFYNDRDRLIKRETVVVPTCM
jgi:hypothetical protein